MRGGQRREGAQRREVKAEGKRGQVRTWEGVRTEGEGASED